jgi:hypothetical protein
MLYPSSPSVRASKLRYANGTRREHTTLAESAEEAAIGPVLSA